MKPSGLIEPWRSQVDLGQLARLLYERYRGRALRVKVRDLAMRLLGVPASHGSAVDVALRNALAELRRQGLPIGSLDGPDGGVFWISNEEERAAVLGMLYAQRNAVVRSIELLKNAPLEWREPLEQTPLDFNPKEPRNERGDPRA